MKKLLIIAVILGLIGAGIFYYIKGYSNGGVNIEVNLPDKEVEVGRPFDVDVVFKNETGSALGDVKIALAPSDFIAFEEDGSTNIKTRELGEISNGVTKRESFKVVALPSEEPEYKVKAIVFYSPATLVAEFKKDREEEVRVKTPDFELELIAPDQVFSGEEFEIKAVYEQDDEVPELAEFEIHIDYPEGFELITSEPEEVDLATGGVKFSNLEEDEGEVSINGSLDLSDSSEFQLRARLVMKMFDEEYTFFSEDKTVLVDQSPLSFQVVLGEHPGEVRPGDKLTYVLTYKNNTDVELRDLVIRAQLLGEMFDFEDLSTDGRYTSANRTITWDGGNTSRLENVRAGEDGSVSFTIDVENRHPINQLSDKNFLLIVDARIESPTVPSSINASKTTNTAKAENKVTGLLEIDAEGYFRDAASGILNSGPFPPLVGNATEYTVHWSVKNHGTDVDNVEVRARLGDGVVFTGETAGNTDTVPEIDSETGEVVWKVGRLLATTGILNAEPEAIFQVSATPMSANIGNYMLLIGETRVSGDDEFTETTIMSNASAIDTRLPDDPTVNAGDGEVQ